MSGPTKLPPRPKAASLFMAVPIVFLGALGLAVAVLFGVTRFGDQTASGEQVSIRFGAACIDDAQAQLLARAEQIAMPATMDGGTMTATSRPSVGRRPERTDHLRQRAHRRCGDRPGRGRDAGDHAQAEC